MTNKKHWTHLRNDLDLKHWRFLGEEMEALGRRLDSARAMLAQSRSQWARWYWQETLDRLMLKWHRLPIQFDSEAKMSVIDHWDIDPNWWEDSIELEGGVADRVFDYLRVSNVNLNRSWEMSRNARLNKACQ